MRQRLVRLLTGCGALLAVGIAYAVFSLKTGLLIPCPLRRMTGLLCPGCGVSHLCLSLLRLDLPGAWAANPGLFLLLPGFLLLAVRLSVRWVRQGSTRPVPWESALIVGMILWLVIWGVLRNV